MKPTRPVNAFVPARTLSHLMQLDSASTTMWNFGLDIWGVAIDATIRRRNGQIRTQKRLATLHWNEAFELARNILERAEYSRVRTETGDAPTARRAAEALCERFAQTFHPTR